MPDLKHCGKATGHLSHEWQSRTPQQTDWQHWLCIGTERGVAPEGITRSIGQATFRNLEKIEFDFVNRENVPTRIIFKDLQPGDARAVVNAVEGDEQWAFVDIRIMARKPYVAREIEDDE